MQCPKRQVTDTCFGPLRHSHIAQYATSDLTRPVEIGVNGPQVDQFFVVSRESDGNFALLSDPSSDSLIGELFKLPLGGDLEIGQREMLASLLQLWMDRGIESLL